MTRRRPTARVPKPSLLGQLDQLRMTNDQDGRVGRTLRTSGVLRPDGARIRLDKDRKHLLYDTRAPQLMDVHRADALDRFLRLDAADPDEVLAFAQRYGVLNVAAIEHPGIYSERLKTWRDYAVRARATLQIASSLYRSEPTSAEDWERLRPWWMEAWDEAAETDDRNRNREVATEQRRLEDVANYWLMKADVRPCVMSIDSGFQLVFTNVSDVIGGQLTLLGVLALQIAESVSRAKNLSACSGCGRVYLRTGRQVQRGRRNYCSDCGRPAALRDAQAAHRARTRGRDP